MKKGFFLLIILVFVLILCACDTNDTGSLDDTHTPTKYEATQSTEMEKIDTTPNQSMEEAQATVMQLKIDDTVVSVEWENNKSVKALKELCADGPLEIQMSMYGGFEQVGSIGTSLPRSDVQTTTQAGDIVLYSGNQMVVFYGSNSWAYTRLGRIMDQTSGDLKRLLGNSDVTITISMENLE